MLVLLLLVARQQHVQVCLLPRRPAGLSWVRLQFPSLPYSCFASQQIRWMLSEIPAPWPPSPASNKPLVVVGRGRLSRSSTLSGVILCSLTAVSRSWEVRA